MRKADKYALTGGAGGTLRCYSGKTNAIAFYAVQPHRVQVFKAASNAFVAEEQALGGVGPNGMLQGFKIACTPIEPRRPASGSKPGVKPPDYPPPSTDSFRRT